MYINMSNDLIEIGIYVLYVLYKIPKNWSIAESKKTPLKSIIFIVIPHSVFIKSYVPN